MHRGVQGAAQQRMPPRADQSSSVIDAIAEALLTLIKTKNRSIRLDKVHNCCVNDLFYVRVFSYFACRAY